MVLKIVHKMSIGEDNTHIALGAISKKSQPLLGFDQLKGRNISHVNVWKFMKAFTPTKKNGKLTTALKNAKHMFDEKKGARENAMKVNIHVKSTLLILAVSTGRQTLFIQLRYSPIAKLHSSVYKHLFNTQFFSLL